jgi:hypothetical protein
MECATVADAVKSLSSYDAIAVAGKVYRYEIQIRFNNTDRINAEFGEKSAAIEFLTKYS